MIYVIGKAPVSSEYRTGEWEDFLEWFKKQDRYQLDVETNVTDFMSERYLISIQFGEYNTSTEFKDQWVLILKDLPLAQQVKVLALLEDASKRKYIHNASFEYQVFLRYNIVLENVYDTMLSEKVLYTGHNNYNDDAGNRFFSLAGEALRRLGLYFDKTLQTEFEVEELTEAHILYAAQDVQFLDKIAEQQRVEIAKYKLKHTVDLENEACLALAEIEYNGMSLDTDAWTGNVDLVEPIVKKYKTSLEGYIYSDLNLYEKAVELGILNLEDKVIINWNSPAKKKELFSLVFPSLEGATKATLRKYLNNPETSLEEIQLLYPIVHEGDYSGLQAYLINYNYQDLVDKGFLIPKDSITINWNSQDQVLPLFKAISKKLKALDEQSLAEVDHPIVKEFRSYKSSVKLMTSYGTRFIEKYVEPDGKVRTRFNQILETGRVSSARPNMQQVPSNEDVGNRYRNCFVPDNENWVFVDSDYSSQELCIVASLSGDPVWLAALKHGQDLHSVCAELVYGAEWKTKADESCKFYKKNKQKCSCKAHKTLRTAVKTVNFGLIYGMSAFKLSSTLGISVKEAEMLIDKYFKVFPRIKSCLNGLAEFGVKNGYIMTLAPFYRKRWFPEWEYLKGEIEFHIQGIKFNKSLGSIERQSMNTPIQGSAADMMKLALVYVRKYINANGLRDKVKLSMQVHDQLTTMCRKEYAEEWKLKLTELMEEAAKVIVPSGLLKAETQVTDKWSK